MSLNAFLRNSDTSARSNRVLRSYTLMNDKGDKITCETCATNQIKVFCVDGRVRFFNRSYLTRNLIGVKRGVFLLVDCKVIKGT